MIDPRGATPLGDSTVKLTPRSPARYPLYSADISRFLESCWFVKQRDIGQRLRSNYKFYQIFYKIPLKVYIFTRKFNFPLNCIVYHPTWMSPLFWLARYTITRHESDARDLLTFSSSRFGGVNELLPSPFRLASVSRDVWLLCWCSRRVLPFSIPSSSIITWHPAIVGRSGWALPLSVPSSFSTTWHRRGKLFQLSLQPRALEDHVPGSR